MKSRKNKRVFVKRKRKKENIKKKIQFCSKLLIWSQGKAHGNSTMSLTSHADAQPRGHIRRYLKSRMVVWVFSVMGKRRHISIKKAWGRNQGAESGYNRHQD